MPPKLCSKQDDPCHLPYRIGKWHLRLARDLNKEEKVKTKIAYNCS